MSFTYDFNKLDTLTKYPSILTYHKLNQKAQGRLVEELSFPNEINGNNIIVTEKLDGENSRLIFIVEDYNIDYFIGTRDEIIYAKGDRIITKKGNMVNTVKPFAELICNNSEFIKENNNSIVVIYSESFGGSVQKASKQYTSDKNIQSIRMFDSFSLPLAEVEQMVNNMKIEQISGWRDHNHQPFISERKLMNLSKLLGIELTPRRNYIIDSTIPTTIQETYDWLKAYYFTEANLDVADNIEVTGTAEGVVVRSENRKFIVKIRFEDYERTLGIRR